MSVVTNIILAVECGDAPDGDFIPAGLAQFRAWREDLATPPPPLPPLAARLRDRTSP